MKNPMRCFKKIESATKVVGFGIEIPSRVKIDKIYVIADKLLESRSGSIVARKAKYDSNGISGIYPGALPKDCFKMEFRNELYSGYLYWNGSTSKPKAYLATFDDLGHKYSYSIYTSRGINLKSMDKWQKMFK